MNSLQTSAEILAFHDNCHATPGWARESARRHASGLWHCVELNHRHNCLLWDEEDLARRKQVPDAEIAANKRAIDGYNQKRNDAIERMDESLLDGLAGVQRRTGARLNSETAGSMIDRLSILSLKIHHMRLQTLRNDVDKAHVESCAARLARFLEQRRDLAGCFDRLLAEAARGDAWFKVYRQFKMYNDPALNPAVYGEKR
ncbi:MAG: DUF4254 domain-containing protein [Proteobacteria bacterium]|nr:DUF4254 domain-containing protein [Pseudomonadota bacterium]